jgi:hypothetical protein
MRQISSDYNKRSMSLLTERQNLLAAYEELRARLQAIKNEETHGK